MRQHDDAEKATERLFEKYRVRSDAGTRAAWTQTIDKEALGFAQHVHGALQAACTVLVARGGTARAEDVGKVKTRANAARDRFYASKTRAIMEEHAEAVLNVVHQATRTNTKLTQKHLASVGQGVDAQTRPSLGRIEQRGSARTDRTHAPPGDPAPLGAGPSKSADSVAAHLAHRSLRTARRLATGSRREKTRPGHAGRTLKGHR